MVHRIKKHHIVRLCKYAHLVTLSHPYTTLDVAQLFLDHVFNIHGTPSTIISDMNLIFHSDFEMNSSN